RSDGHLGVRVQLLNRVRQQVSGGMPEDLETLRIPVGHDGQMGIAVDDARRIDQHAVDLTGERRLGETRTDTGRDLRHGDGGIEALLASVGKSNYRHKTIVTYGYPPTLRSGGGAR